MDKRQINFRPMALSTLQPNTGYVRPYFSTPRVVTVMDCALEVMTDLNFVPAAVIQEEIDIESATHKMIARGVRSLLVTDRLNNVVGIVTSRDLIGDRPQQVMQQLGIPFAEVKVSHIMTAGEHIEVIPFREVLHARVGDVIMTLKHSGRQHALVVEETEYGERPMIRGIFSATQIARQLGIAIQQPALAQTFAEIDRAIQEAS